MVDAAGGDCRSSAEPGVMFGQPGRSGRRTPDRAPDKGFPSPVLVTVAFMNVVVAVGLFIVGAGVVAYWSDVYSYIVVWWMDRAQRRERGAGPSAARVPAQRTV